MLEVDVQQNTLLLKKKRTHMQAKVDTLFLNVLFLGLVKKKQGENSASLKFQKNVTDFSEISTAKNN